MQLCLFNGKILYLIFFRSSLSHATPVLTIDLLIFLIFIYLFIYSLLFYQFFIFSVQPYYLLLSIDLGYYQLYLLFSFVPTKLSQIETYQRFGLENSFVDLRHCSDNYTYLTKSKVKGLLLLKNKSMALNLSNIIVSRTGTNSETTFQIYLCTNVPIYTQQSKAKRQVKDYLIGKY